MPRPSEEKHPEIKSTKEYFLETLDDLANSNEAVAKRKEQLRLVTGLIDQVEAGGVLDAIVQGKGVVNTITDVGSDSIAFVFNGGWALGFEGDGGELVIVIDYINQIKPHKSGGLLVDMETGECVILRFLGKVAAD
ncbi:MAG TPA: hypothetical protein VK191_01360 [Symbiobacteriaceae bacterium]|nr:hypothetical protein [Symbiobacteriaceae bacterium]